MTILQDILAALNWQIRVNENFSAVSPAALFAKKDATTTGLTLGYYGGVLDGVSYADGTHALTASTTRYVVVKRSDGVVSSDTATTNWNNATDYMRMGVAVVGASTITSWADWREAYAAGGGGSGSGDVVGPASAVDDRIATFDGTTGKLIQDGGKTIAELRAPSVQSVTSAASVTPTFSDDLVKITAQATGLTLVNPTGTAIDGLGMVIRIKDDGTARSIGYGTQYRAIGVTLPTTTVVSKTLYLAMIFNNEDTTWDVVAVGQEP